MKRIALMAGVLLLCVAVFDNKSGAAGIIGFEGFVGGTLITNQYESEGIIFDGAWVGEGLGRGTTPNWISGEIWANDNLDPDVVSGYFVDPNNTSQFATTNHIEALGIYADSDTLIILDVFDIDGILLGTSSKIDDGLLSVSISNIHSFTLYHENPGIDDLIGFDDIMFNPVTPFAPVPEPATLAIFGTICLVACGRRRKS